MESLTNDILIHDVSNSITDFYTYVNFMQCSKIIHKNLSESKSLISTIWRIANPDDMYHTSHVAFAVRHLFGITERAYLKYYDYYHEREIAMRKLICKVLTKVGQSIYGILVQKEVVTVNTDVSIIPPLWKVRSFPTINLRLSECDPLKNLKRKRFEERKCIECGNCLVWTPSCCDKRAGLVCERPKCHSRRCFCTSRTFYE